MPDIPPKLLTSQEAAEVLNVSNSWMAQSRLTGKGPSFICVGARRLYSPDDLSAWMASKRRQSTSQISVEAGASQ